MWVRKNEPGSAPGHTWENAGDVLEVADDLGMDLVVIPNGGFTEVPAPAEDPAEPEPATGPDPAADADPELATEVDEAPPHTARKPGARTKPATK